MNSKRSLIINLLLVSLVGGGFFVFKQMKDLKKKPGSKTQGVSVSIDSGSKVELAMPGVYGEYGPVKEPLECPESVNFIHASCMIFKTPRGGKWKTGLAKKNIFVNHEMTAYYDKAWTALKGKKNVELEDIWSAAFGFFVKDYLDLTKLANLEGLNMYVRMIVEKDGKIRHSALATVSPARLQDLYNTYDRGLDNYLKAPDLKFMSEVNQFVRVKVMRDNFEVKTKEELKNF